jgi:hypothetical protein
VWEAEVLPDHLLHLFGIGIGVVQEVADVVDDIKEMRNVVCALLDREGNAAGNNHLCFNEEATLVVCDVVCHKADWQHGFLHSVGCRPGVGVLDNDSVVAKNPVEFDE